MNFISDEESLAISEAVDRTEHAVHGGWDVNAAFEVVCAWDGEVIFRSGEVKL